MEFLQLSDREHAMPVNLVVTVGPQATVPAETRERFVGFHVRILNGTGITAIQATGEVDSATADEFRAHLRAADELDSAPKGMVVDLSRVTFLSSAGLSALIEREVMCRSREIPLVLVAQRRVVTRPLDVAGLADRIVTVPSMRLALVVLRLSRRPATHPNSRIH
ncbi:anti-sigma factor antagonist [Pseudonocardiaceae bacterium YIM PH 21723]|nr:anti-sigma factor antagonist [Pseudonocardiaceae bacterium YIM PH 21723]